MLEDMRTRRDGRGPALFAAAVAVLVVIVWAILFARPALAPGAGLAPGGGAAPAATAAPTPSPVPPELAIAHPVDLTQAPRFLRAAWTSTQPVTSASLALAPEPGFACEATVAGDGRSGTLGCAGLLAGPVEYTATLTVRTPAGAYPATHRFQTMGDRLEGVKWFTEFEDPHGQPLACAAASVRIVQNHTTGEDKATAEAILRQGQSLNRSRDPGIDPVAIATVQKSLDARNSYHYYRFATKQEATLAAAYWLLRSGKPVHAITLAGQHDPLVVGFEGHVGTHFGDPSNRIDAMIVMDPQRGDMRPETMTRRPDMYRTPGFQTGQPIVMPEWYGGEWWFGFAYAGVVDGVNIERNDGAYPLPHWAGTFVLLVDDGDADWPSDREGRVQFR